MKWRSRLGSAELVVVASPRYRLRSGTAQHNGAAWGITVDSEGWMTRFSKDPATLARGGRKCPLYVRCAVIGQQVARIAELNKQASPAGLKDRLRTVRHPHPAVQCMEQAVEGPL